MCQCPVNPDHLLYTIVTKNIPEPHYGKEECAECGAFIKWISRKEAGMQAEAEHLKCPVTLSHEDGPLNCHKQNCAWWCSWSNRCAIVDIASNFALMKKVV